jgi:nucleoside-diphosphate-sugar epimerase
MLLERDNPRVSWQGLLLLRLTAGLPPILYERQGRDFIFIDDVINAILLAINRNSGGKCSLNGLISRQEKVQQ